MGDIKLDVFARYLRRCREIAAEPDMKPGVVRVYEDILKPYAEPYLARDAAVAKALSTWAKENREAIEAVEALEQPFRAARAIALAYEPTLVLPETLKTQPTDTNKIVALETLIDTIDDYVGTPWADEILAGELGTKGPIMVQEINESIAADKTVADAREKRAEEYRPTYERFVRFKRVVRNALGPSSQQYRRIHGRASQAPEPNEEVGGGGPTGDPTA